MIRPERHHLLISWVATAEELQRVLLEPGVDTEPGGRK